MKAPILIGGSGRCGTALLMFMMQRCPVFHVLNEPKTPYSAKEYEQILTESGKERLVIKEPHLIRSARALKVMLPELKILHIIRDPRDIFASVKSLPWGPSTAEEFVTWYKGIMEDAWLGREALFAVHGDDYMTIWLEELVDEEKTWNILEKLLRFTGIQDRRVIKEWYKLVDYKIAHIGRWLWDDGGLKTSESRTVFNGTQELFEKWVNVRSTV